MNPDESHCQTCRECGAALSFHDLDGLCSRCVARFTLLELAAPSSEPADSSFPKPLSSALGRPAPTRFGDYELLEEIARGGMGVVYRARQVSLDRVVAVKMLLLGQFAAPGVFQRFRAEAVAAASLQHPNLVAIHEVGTHDGQPFFSMDYVVGRNLADLVRDRPLPARAAAQYLAKIARAVQFAHDHGIVHRDLKPANILVDESDEPRITDFGLAKRLTPDSSLATDRSSLTLSGQVLGSPNFLPPEQAGGHARTIGPACDIYGLGAVLYYLLTGRPPFVAETFESTLFHVLNSEPVAPRQLNPSVSRDLETICLKCLEKAPGRRYASAQALSDELERCLKGEPIHARPVGHLGRTWRWCRRKPLVAALVAAVVALLLTVTGVSLGAAWRIATARKTEQRQAYYSSIALANEYVGQGSVDRALETLWQCPEQYRHWEWGHLLYLCHQEAASFQAHATNVTATIFSPDSRWVMSQDSVGTAKVWDWEAEEQVFSFGSTSNRAGWVAFQPSGGQLAAAMGTNGAWVWATTNWAPDRGSRRQEAHSDSGQESPSLLTSAATSQPLTRPSDTLSPSDGERVGERGASPVSEKDQPLLRLLPKGGEVTTLAYSPSGEQLVTGGADGTVTVWDSGSGQELKSLETANQPIRRVSISPDGQRIVAVAERAAWVWELNSGKLIRRFPHDLVAADVSRRTSRSPEVSGDSPARLLQEADLTRPSPPQSSTSRMPTNVFTVFADDTGEQFATIDQEGHLALWCEGRAPQPLIAIKGSQPGLVRRVFFGPDGRCVINAGEEITSRLWALPGGTERLAISERVHRAIFNADGTKLVTRGAESWVTTWDLTKARKLKVLRGHAAMVTGVDLSRDGRLAVTGDRNGVVKVWSAGPGREQAEDRSWQYGTSYSPDGRLIATCPSGEGLLVRSARSGRVLLRLHSPNEFFNATAFSPESRRLVTAGTHKTAKVWDVKTGELLLRLRGHRRQLYSTAYSRDGQLIATGSFDGTAKVWDASTGSELRTLFMDPERRYTMTGLSNVVAVDFDLDGTRLVTANSRSQVNVWDLSAGKALVTIRAGEAGVDPYVKLLPDGKHFITCLGSGNVVLWELSSGRLRKECRTRGINWQADTSHPDGRRMVTAGTLRPIFGFDYGTIEIWDIEGRPREVLTLRGGEMFTSIGFSSDAQRVFAGSLDFRVYQWESLPWDARSYLDEPEPRSPGATEEPAFAAQVRRYANRYWRERLKAEQDGVEGEPVEPRVVRLTLDRTLLPPRDPRATANQLDLTAAYTGELGEMSHASSTYVTQDYEDDLSAFPTGLIELGGVAFDVRGVIQLRRSEPRGGAWEVEASADPVRVDSIPVHQEAGRLHLLVGTILPEAEGTVIGRLELRYADGETRSVDLVYGQDVRDWWYDPAKADAETTTRGKVVWTGTNPTANEYGRRLRLYVSTRDNPRAGMKTTTFDFVSAMTGCAPFLVAVTVE